MVSQDMETVLATTRSEIPVISFVGDSGTGKTTLLEEVVKRLKQLGYRVGVIKHSHHDFEIDIPGKDTWRLTKAGCDVVAISSPGKLAVLEQVDEELTLTQIETIVRDKVDIVLTEGYKGSNTTKIIVILASEQDREQFCCDEQILATVSACWSLSGLPKFSDETITDVTKLLVEWIARGSSQKLSPSPNLEWAYANQILQI